MEHVKDELQGDVECIEGCEVLQWPGCGRPSNTFTHLTRHPNLFVRSILVDNSNSSLSYVVVVEGILKADDLLGWRRRKAQSGVARHWEALAAASLLRPPHLRISGCKESKPRPIVGATDRVAVLRPGRSTCAIEVEELRRRPPS